MYCLCTRFTQHISTTLLDSTKNQFVPIEKHRVKNEAYPIIVEAFLLGEENAVPVDVVELLNEKDQTELILKKGEYSIRIMDKDKTFSEYQIKVE